MKIAIFGAGQLAMMMIQADKNALHNYVVIDPSSEPPASLYAVSYTHLTLPTTD